MAVEIPETQNHIDDEYENALLGDVGLATRTNPNIPLSILFPELANQTSQSNIATQNDHTTDTPAFIALLNIIKRAHIRLKLSSS